MGKMSNGKIERIAVSAVEAEANKPSVYLIPNIPTGDKGISFDGQIDVFVDDSGRTESFVGSVPVQVKGKGVKKFTEGKISYSLNLSHFKNFYKRDGTLLLVVEINEEGKTKIFYKQLLPMELRRIIQEFSWFRKQKTRSVELRPLEETTLYAVCRKFLYEKDFQPKILVENEPLFFNSSFTKYCATSLTFDPSHAETSNIFDHDFTIYGVIDDDMRVPLDQGRIESMSATIEGTFEIDGKKYLFNTRIINKKHENTIVIEEVFEFKINLETKKFTVQFLKFRSLAIQLKVIPFVLSFLSGHTLYFMGKSMSVNNTRTTKNLLKSVKNIYSTFKDLQKVFNLLGIDENKIISETETDPDLYPKFLFLIRALLYNDTKGLKVNPLGDWIINFEIGDQVIVLLYQHKEKKLINLFSEEMQKVKVEIVLNEKDRCPHCIYVMLKKDSLAKGANINHQVIRDSFNQIDPFLNDLSFTHTNLFCLECINAYDISKNSDLLDTAEYIYSKYKWEGSSQSPTFDDAVVTINLCQIRKRKFGSLEPEDIEQLIRLKNYFPYGEYIELHFCVNVLLESKIEAAIAYNKMTPEQQEDFKTLPIIHLYNELLIN
ncbi:DUF4365 domain-containing protein [Brevibacillus marinus]|uniref:DUF4365 domain-containing protein n=1 Tax=Brevibacillus marinus TaxID=2496837 RepID=UPI000F83F58F|nr:DUF4365 domain-containing protein [Brevibacillus marinus]